MGRGQGCRRPADSLTARCRASVRRTYAAVVPPPALQPAPAPPPPLLAVAPELLMGDPCTEKCDVFSFGIVLWELVTGVRRGRGWEGRFGISHRGKGGAEGRGGLDPCFTSVNCFPVCGHCSVGAEPPATLRAHTRAALLNHRPATTTPQPGAPARDLGSISPPATYSWGGCPHSNTLTHLLSWVATRRRCPSGAACTTRLCRSSAPRRCWTPSTPASR